MSKLETTSVSHATTDYGMFHFLPTNRPINPGHLQWLIDEIRECNLLVEFAIVVDEDMNVLDGQHRLKAAQILHVPIWFKISTRMKPKHIGRVNRSQRIWQLTDYLHAYLDSDNTEYKLLNDFIDEYKGIHLSDAINLCHYRNGDGPSKVQREFKDGGYIANNLGFAKQVAAAILDFKPYLPTHFCQRVFVHAIEHLMSDPRYDHTRMVAKLVVAGRSKLQPMVSTKAYFPLLNDIYNYRVRGDEIVEFTFRKPSRHTKVTA